MVEIAVALVIVTIASVGGFASHHASRSLIRQSEEEAVAASDIENAMNRLLILDVDELVDPDGTYPDGQTMPEFTDANLGSERVLVDYPNLLPGTAPDLLEIRLTLTWESAGGQPRSLIARTCKAK